MSRLHPCLAAGLAVLLVALAVPTGRAAAHGGGTPRLVNVPAGPYQLSAWTQPDPIRTGDLHVTVAVTAPESGAPVLAARVEVAVIHPGASDDPSFVEAIRGITPNKLLHDVDLEIPAAGDYGIALRVTGPAGTGRAGFNLSILPPAQNGTGSVVVSIAAVSLMLTLLSLRRFFGIKRPKPLSRSEQLVTPDKEAIL
jgi:hypothetical protein